MLDDSFRGAAEENAPPSRPAVGGHNNQVGVDLAGQLTDLFESVPGQNMSQSCIAFADAPITPPSEKSNRPES